MKDQPAAQAVTAGPRHHYFGYYDKFPWDRTGRFLLGMEVDFEVPFDARTASPPGDPLTPTEVQLRDFIVVLHELAETAGQPFGLFEVALQNEKVVGGINTHPDLQDVTATPTSPAMR